MSKERRDAAFLGPDEINGAISRAKPQILAKTREYVSSYARMLDNPPMNLTKEERVRLRELGHTFRSLRSLARLPISLAAEEAAIEESTLFLFEGGFVGGEVISVGALCTLHSAIVKRLAERHIELGTTGVCDIEWRFVSDTRIAGAAIGQVLQCSTWISSLRAVDKDLR